MGQALYRKYRSKALDEVVGQEHVTSTIKNALKSGSISHAYLFTGPKGVGKTSVARILAHEINNLAYDESTNYLDIIEIDAASNRRIDEIRDLRDKVNIAPSSAKYKVYIIDEVHMLTKESFNALLKTLEEPPDHVVFILATTEAHKLPDTIISRTQHFNFKPIDEKVNVSHLQNIAKSEGIVIDQEAIALIAKHGAGSFRDSISMLDQLSSVSSDKISLNDVQTALGIAPDDLVMRIVEAVDNAEVTELVAILSQARSAGYNSSQLAVQLSKLIRTQIITGLDPVNSKFDLLKALVDVPASQDPDGLLEIILLEALFTKHGSALQQSSRPDIELPQNEPEPAQANVELKVEISEAEPIVNEGPKDSVDLTSSTDDLEPWQKILALLKSKHNTLYSVARMAQCEIVDHNVNLSFSFPFHYKRIIEPKNKEILEETVRSVLGAKYRLVCNLKAKTNVEIIEKQDNIKDISNIFGDVEVLES